MDIVDHCTIAQKKGYIDDALSAASTSNAKWFINYSSGSGGIVPIEVAREIMPHLMTKFSSWGKNHYGTVVMDFPELESSAVIPLIIATNTFVNPT